MADESFVAAGRGRAKSNPGQDFAIEREATERPEAPPKAAGSQDAAHERSDVTDGTSALYPRHIARKYYGIDAGARTGERRVFADERGEYLVFKDEGHRLTTRREEAVVVRDLVAIAQHREWSALRVTGSEAFRREVWLEASARGIDVSGYRPTDLDMEARARRAADWERRNDREGPGRGPGAGRASDWTAPPSRTGRVSERRDALSGIPDRTVLVVQPETGMAPRYEPRARGHRWRVPNDRLRSLPRGEVIKDANLAAAHSHLAVLDRALRRAFPDNGAARDAVLAVARERLALHLEEGRPLQRAAYSVPMRGREPEQAASAHRAEPVRGARPRREQCEQER